MRHLVSFFPSASPGVALVLSRVLIAISLVEFVAFSQGLPAAPVPMIVAIGLAVGLCAGFMTTALCALVILMRCLIYFHGAGGTPFEASALVMDIGQLIALALLGPGAYSWDARRFGRHIVVLPK